MNAATALSVLILLSGCAATLAPRAIEGAVKLGEIAAVGGLRVRPDRLVEDSRCPIGTQCVWAGRVVLRATVLGGSRSREMELTLRQPAAVADGLLTLVSVLPERLPDRPVEPQQLNFKFVFRGSS